MPDYSAGSAYLDILPSMAGFGDQVRAKLDEEDNISFDVAVKPNLDRKAMADVDAAVKADTDALSRDSAIALRVKLDAASVAATEAKIKELQAQADSVSAAGAGAGGGGGVGVGALIAGGVAVGSGALGGAALALIPAVFTAIGVEAEKSNPIVQQALAGMETSAKAALVNGFEPFVPTLAGIATETGQTITALQPEFHAAADAAAPMLQAVSSGLLQATRDGVTGSVSELRTLQPVAQAVGDDFVKVEQGVMGLFHNIDVGSAAQGLELLGTDVKDLLPTVGQLVSTVAPLGNALLGVLGPALVVTGNDLSTLKPLFEATGAVVQYLGPEIAVLALPLTAASAATKLLTGSWLSFGEAGSKVLGVFTNYKSTLTSLANAIGVTTAKQNDANKTALDSDATMKRLIADADAEAAAQAKNAIANDDSAAAKLADAQASKAAAASAETATAAETSLAAAEEGVTFSAGPLGIVLGVVGLALAPLAMNALKGSQATDQFAGSLQKLEQAASDQHALANLFQTDPNAEKQLALLQKYGVTLHDLAAANDGDAQAQRKVADAAKQAMDATNAKVDADHKAIDAANSVNQNSDQGGAAYLRLAQAAKTAKDALGADTTAQASATSVYNDAKGQLDATNAAQKAMTGSTQQATTVITLNGQQQAAASTQAQALKMATGTVTDAFQHLVAANPKDSVDQLTAAFVADEVAVNQASQTISTTFQQADQQVQQAAQSLVNANHSYAQSLTAVTDAQHSYAQSQTAVVTAERGVVTARQAVTDAVANVGIAENNLSKAEAGENQALTNLNNARLQAVQNLKSLRLQVNDQAVSEESARLKLFQQQQTSAAYGVTAANAQAIAGQQATSTNQAQIQAALDLLSAQNSLADTLNSGVNLRQQYSTAQKQGVDGAPAVVAAQQAVQNAQDQVTSSAQALVKAQQQVVTAQQGVVTAEQGVSDALYNEQKAAQAVRDAEYNVQQQSIAVTNAKQQLTQAEQNASHSLDITTAAGVRNYGMLKTLAGQLDALYGPQQANNLLIQETANLFGISTDKAKKLLDNLHLLENGGTPYSFDVKAVASVDLGALESHLHISGTNINLKAAGGYISGPGGPRDDKIPAMLSNGEYVVNAAATAQHFGLLQHINGMADGGLVVDNIGFGILGINYQTGVDTLGVMGFPHPPGLPAYTPATGAPGGQINYSGPLGVTQWAPQILQALSLLSQPASWLGTVERRMNQESGGNPTVVNRWDSNWLRGTPSVGLMQVIGPTFAANAGPFAGVGPFEYGTSVNPLANIYAGLHYALGRYGSLSALNRPGGYDSGGWLPPGLQAVYNGTSQPEAILTNDQWQAITGRGSGGEFTGSLYLDSGQFLGVVRGEIASADHAIGNAIMTGTRH